MFSTIFLFLNIGTPEMILIMFVALMLFGGEKLPVIARGLGKGIRDFKDASEGVKREINNQINNYEEKKPAEPVAPPVTEAITDHTEVESRPLVNTTPIAGTLAVGETHAEETPHPADAYTGHGHITETHAGNTPAEPVKTTHE